MHLQQSVLVQGREGKQDSPTQKGQHDQAGAAARSAATASAFSRHPDLAEVPVLDVALESSEGADADGVLAQRQKRAASAVFVPLAVTPAVERMLQVRLPHLTQQLVLVEPSPLSLPHGPSLRSCGSISTNIWMGFGSMSSLCVFLCVCNAVPSSRLFLQGLLADISLAPCAFFPGWEAFPSGQGSLYRFVWQSRVLGVKKGAVVTCIPQN